jgi:hypothetical protein
VTALMPMPRLLVWLDGSHYDHRGDLPCVLCGGDTPLRSHQREPVHKCCAERWNEENPRELHKGRFVSDAQPRRGDRAVHA